MGAELPFAGGSGRGPIPILLSLVLGGALLFVANFGSRLGVKNLAYRPSGAAMPPKKQTPKQRDRNAALAAAGSKARSAISAAARAGAVPPSARRRTL